MGEDKNAKYSVVYSSNSLFGCCSCDCNLYFCKSLTVNKGEKNMKFLDFLKKWIVEIGLIAVGLLLLFLPFTPYALKTFGFGAFFATLLNPLIKHIIKSNTKS